MRALWRQFDSISCVSLNTERRVDPVPTPQHKIQELLINGLIDAIPVAEQGLFYFSFSPYAYYR